MITISLSEIARLSVSERIQLVEDIWDTLAPEDLPLPDSQRAELERRLQAYRADPQPGTSWQEVKRRIRA